VGQRVLVGSVTELWERLERSRLELRVEEERAEAAEAARDAAERRAGQLERRAEEPGTGGGREPEEPPRPASRVGALEAECCALRASLRDIGSLVAGQGDPATPRRPRALLPPPLGLTPRRSRSAEPGVLETTVSAVQAALNSKQTQLYELQTRVSGMEGAAGRAATALLTWETRARAAEAGLAAAEARGAATGGERAALELRCRGLQDRLLRTQAGARGQGGLEVVYLMMFLW
jgi:hypothetical protein